MVFTEPGFALFFLLTFVGYWALPNNRLRVASLVVASAVFYGAWDWRFLGLLGLVILVTWLAQAAIFRTKTEADAQQTVILSTIFLLFVLGLFKYFNFFADTFVVFAQRLGWNVSGPLVDIILPVGVSFYIFQAIGYIIDVRRRVFDEPEGLLNVAFFVAFFPQLVAGPIVRAKDFFPQIARDHRLSEVPWSGVIVLFVGGFFKKVVVADNIGHFYVDPVFANPQLFDSASIIFGVLAYAGQIYCDFSGYSDMAIAVSRCFGYQLPINFRAPYFSASVTDFWRRWHISLSHWLRDYLYISLGGNRSGITLTYRNLIVTMLLGGLWHGASWNFLFWGYFHGALLALERLSGFPDFAQKGPVRRLISGCLTFYFVCIAWVFFRSTNFDISIFIVSTMIGVPSPGAASLGPTGWVVACALLAMHFLVFRFRLGSKLARLPAPAMAALGGVALSCMFPFVPSSTQPFIYFQF